MAYSEKVIDHYENPRNVGTLDKDDPSVGTGLVGAPACGDVMRLQIRVSPEGIIQDAKFKTFGCGSAIASSSLATEWLKGKTVDEANTIKNTMLVEELNLPPVKVHCSVLAEDAIKSAIEDFRRKQVAKRAIDEGQVTTTMETMTDTTAASPSANETAATNGDAAALAAKGITLSPKAVEMAKVQLAKRGTPDAAIRLGLRGGGCSGFTYVIEFSDDPPRARDRMFTFDGVRVYVDPKSLVYLAGTVLDWEKTLMYQGFKFKNPHEATGCGCGHSFSVKA